VTNKKLGLIVLTPFVLFFVLVNSKLQEQKLLTQEPRIKQRIKGGVVPHHLVAEEMINDFFKSFTIKPKKIILIGPNHQEKKFPVVTSSSNSLTSAISSSPLVGIDDQLIKEEHAISNLLPYLEKYFPNAEIVPLIFKNQFKEKELREFTAVIKPNFDQQTVIIGSIDFSHYLKPVDAAENDQQTLKAIKTFNYSTLLKKDSAYLDSPSALVFLLLLMEQQGTTSLTVLDHKSSADFTPRKTRTTTYYTLLYR
jgi:AmmeMemoRadiSam system protein B